MMLLLFEAARSGVPSVYLSGIDRRIDSVDDPVHRRVDQGGRFILRLLSIRRTSSDDLPDTCSSRPITQLKTRTAELVREVSERGRPITITQNGEAKVVVMDVENYDRWRASLALLKLLAVGEADVERGRTVKQSEAFRRARKELERSDSDA